MASNTKLTAKQELFCKEYIIDFNATGAARRAGYSEKAAQQQGAENLTKPVISRKIARLVEKRNKKVEIDAEYVLHRLLEIDQMDALDILEDDGSIKPVSKWPKVWRTYLSGIDVSEMKTEDGLLGAVKKIKWPDKVKNLELIGKHINVQAFKDRAEVDVTITHEQWLEQLD